jgi:hypothetical protein
MSLNLSNGTGTYTHHIRYMASTSSWSMSATGEGQKGQIPFQFTQAIIDLANIQTGWCMIAEAQAPEWVMDASLTQPAAKPTDGRDWKRGFKVSVFSKSLFGDEPIREYGTSGTGSVKSLEALYAQYEAEASKNVGMVPVVEYKGSVPLKVGKGNTTVPTLTIVKWIPRPAELNGNVVEAKPAAQPAPVASAVSEF